MFIKTFRDLLILEYVNLYYLYNVLNTRLVPIQSAVAVLISL